MIQIRFLLIIVAIALSAQVFAQPLKVASIFSDDMVLQRGKPVPVWGTAPPGARIRVQIGSEAGAKSLHSEAAAKVGQDGRWKAELPPMKAGGPAKLSVHLDDTSTSAVELSNVLIGDVWLCSGQSNMGFTLPRAREGKKDAEQSSNTLIRLFKVGTTVSPEPLTDLKEATGWQVCGLASVTSFSAVAYYFGRDLQKHMDVPVGLVMSAVGGTPAEAWMSREALLAFPEFKDKLPGAEKPEPTPAPAKKAKAKPRPTRQPSVLYNAMIAPLVPFAMKGAIWYQGESNAPRAQQYRQLFPALIKDWRAQWKDSELPFFFVQLPLFHERKAEPADDTWAELRDAQLNTFRTLENTGMVVTVDTGDAKNIHPVDKEPVGHRLALAAQAIAYGEKVAWSGPIYKASTVEEGRVRVTFDYVGRGLKTCDNSNRLLGFAIAGADRKFVWADAVIEPSGKSVLVSSSQVSDPKAVRYAWQANPDANLCNKDGFPASPFRTDDWPGLSEGKTTDQLAP